jgi:eukaryotic-like serine/threonine-protein kinase
MPLMHIHERLGTLVAGRYRLRRIIGEGGMGAVFEAEVVPGGQRVAVKLIKPEYSSSHEVNARFVQEARAAASIGHPNIPAVLDAGTDDDGPYLVLELLKGETLADLLDRRAAGPREALTIAAETVDALRAAHAVGVVHRDIKPENIFLVGGAETRTSVKLLDFGISKILTEQAMGGGLTRVGTAVGTPDYMSPEQASGNRVDGRADLWSMGAVLYEAIALKTPFEGESYQQLLTKILLHPHQPLREAVPAVHPEVSSLIDRALQKEPAQRFPDAATMHAEILRVLSVTPPDESLGIGADESTGSFSNEATKVYDFQGVRARRRSRAGSSGTKEALVAPPPDLSLPQVVSALPRAALPSVPPPPPPPRLDVSALATSPSGPPMAFAGYPTAPAVVSAPPYRPMPSERPAPPAPPEASGGRRPLLIVAAVITALLVVAAGLSLRRAPASVEPHEHLAVAPAAVDASLPLPNAALDVGVVALPVVQQVLQRPRTPAPPPAPPRPRSENPERTERPERTVRTLPAPAGDGRPLDSSEFIAAVSPSTPRFSQCLHGQGGTVDVNVAIDARGRLGDTAFRRPPQGSDEAECIARVLRGLRFPRNRPTSTRLYLNVR